MRDIITVDFKNEKYYKWILEDLIELFEDYDFPCWLKDDDIKRIQITDIKVTLSIKGSHLFIDIQISPKETLSIPLKINEIDFFQYERIPGIKDKTK